MVKVISTEPIGNYKLRIVLSEGRAGTFDVTPYIDRVYSAMGNLVRLVRASELF